MKRCLTALFALSLLAVAACKQKTAESPAAKVITPADMTAMADAVPKTGPKEGNNYKVFFLALRSDQSPAVGFRVDAWVTKKSEPLTLKTNESGLVIFENLPFPDSKHPLNTVLHYYKGAEDQAREITYPFIESDAYRLKDTQYIPNTATPEPQP
jgi:hypothetical protein